MKKQLSLSILALLVLATVLVVPSALAVSIGTGVGVNIVTEDYEPNVWMCDSRIVYDDNTEPGRLYAVNGVNKCSGNQNGDADGQEDCELLERQNNYAFEGEQLHWRVLVFDKNGIEKVKDVFGTVGDVQGPGNDIEVNCRLDKVVKWKSEIESSCNARVDQATLKDVFVEDSNTAAYYDCLLTVETPDSMYGEYWVTVEAEDLDGLSGTMKENEFWFFNPVVALSIEGTLEFDEVRPGTQSYSETILIGNDADSSSGVRLDMFITGTDFYDSSSSGAKCPTTNQLALRNFAYYATNGAYSSQNDPRGDKDGIASNNGEGYEGIEYGIGFNDPSPFYDRTEIIQSTAKDGPYYKGNILTPGAEMAITFRLALPEPCNGDFDSGQIFFWGEAI